MADPAKLDWFTKLVSIHFGSGYIVSASVDISGAGSTLSVPIGMLPKNAEADLFVKTMKVLSGSIVVGVVDPPTKKMEANLLAWTVPADWNISHTTTGNPPTAVVQGATTGYVNVGKLKETNHVSMFTLDVPTLGSVPPYDIIATIVYFERGNPGSFLQPAPIPPVPYTGTVTDDWPFDGTIPNWWVATFYDDPHYQGHTSPTTISSQLQQYAKGFIPWQALFTPITGSGDSSGAETVAEDWNTKEFTDQAKVGTVITHFDKVPPAWSVTCTLYKVSTDDGSLTPLWIALSSSLPGGDGAELTVHTDTTSKHERVWIDGPNASDHAAGGGGSGGSGGSGSSG